MMPTSRLVASSTACQRGWVILSKYISPGMARRSMAAPRPVYLLAADAAAAI